MSSSKHSVESEGSNPRDHNHARHHFWRHAHRDWRVWIAVMLMLAAILTYVVTDSLSLRPGKLPTQPTPEISAPLNSLARFRRSVKRSAISMGIYWKAVVLDRLFSARARRTMTSALQKIPKLDADPTRINLEE